MKLAKVGSPSNHGGQIITAPPNTVADTNPIATVGGSLHACPIQGHGITPMVTGSATVFLNGQVVCRVGDSAQCGAVIIDGSPDINLI